MTKPLSQNSEQAIDRSTELPMSDHHHALEEAVAKIEPPRVRHPSRHAFVHLKKAWQLHPVDAEMSLFRAITAEEEAATALIRALKAQKYPGSEHLNDRQHPHKAAIWPFLDTVRNFLHEKNVLEPRISLVMKERPRVELSVDIGTRTGLDEPLFATPDEPLNFVMRSDQNGPFEVHTFEKELQTLAEGKGALNILKHIQSEANLRNRVLYASEGGIPNVAFQDTLLQTRLMRVTAILTITIAVMQTPAHQLFILQCLEGLLRALGKFDGSLYDYPSPQPGLGVVEQPDGSMKFVETE